MSSAYYLAKPISTARKPTPPQKMAPVTLDDIPTLTKLYQDRTIVPDNDVSSSYTPSATLNDKISIIRRDITTLAIDAIVNAANTSLLGGGGVDGAIHRAAGPKLYDECETLDGCETGNAKMTRGYELPSKKVIHAVGPIYWKEGRSASAKLLSMCYRTSLQLAVDNECRSIAFSALSTGVYGYPSDEAAVVALQTVRQFLDEDGKAEKLDRVIFCNFLEKDENAYYREIQKYFPMVQSVEDTAGQDEPDAPVETSTEPSEILSQLPDAPTEDPKDITDIEEPSTKKQKTEDTDDDFVVVEKEDAKEDKPKPEL
ncbi:ADP-ribose phosphatase [Parastagonospora nodorum]|uniref:ADP-ribose phosphatase n=2 Tax=Phaeosphaeria nodorum (strain SN15 / ATCC MYA-4574 / FGSC 10173) TaxID=321614 RepID=A0A7U2NPA1_PHANO|nr:ADP-ribose phosphatase [Parastagonospora nodorum]QRD05536.1 ADP-ribose phosphatase [Parastagonospora nodorum SN15]KAH3931684.1 ADP-ribose phosphatase [Parastagonospora nodorum]KAH3947420.1 ADP-ribose phosphatase [Parastagonospora nodorum]KAH3970753.1 ADP-ribose phosphatase [Parastagonospora nodorum]